VQEVKQVMAELAHHELRRNRKRLGALTAEQEAAIEEILIPALVNKLSHPIILQMRASAKQETPAEMLEELKKMLRVSH
jgi:glutamyl-tRNA reductase